MGKTSLSVIIPCYNEVVNLQKGVLLKVADFLKRQNYSWEVIIVDDGSPDKSVNLIEEFIKDHQGFTLIKNPHQGKALTVATGMLAAKGNYVLFIDMDQATPIEEAENLLPYFPDNDIIIGSRNSQREGAPLTRIVMARGFMFLRNFLLGVKVTDTQCGFKAFKKNIVTDLLKGMRIYNPNKGKEIKGPIVTAGFDVELLFLAQKRGYKIKEIPVKWRYAETRRVGIFKDSWQALTDMIKIRFNDILGIYD